MNRVRLFWDAAVVTKCHGKCDWHGTNGRVRPVLELVGSRVHIVWTLHRNFHFVLGIQEVPIQQTRFNGWILGEVGLRNSAH